MEFLLQLLAELFDTEPEQQQVVAITETSSNEFINTGIIAPFTLDDYESEMEMPSDEGVIFDLIRFH